MADMDELAQGLRRAHCSNKERDHDCVGTCTITVKGIELDCKLCGSDSQPLVALRATWRREAERAKKILGVAGLDFDVLAPLTQRAVIAELVKDCCPGCGTRVSLNDEYVTCACGDWVKRRGGWGKTAEHLRKDLAKAVATKTEPDF